MYIPTGTTDFSIIYKNHLLPMMMNIKCPLWNVFPESKGC